MNIDVFCSKFALVFKDCPDIDVLTFFYKSKIAFFPTYVNYIKLTEYQPQTIQDLIRESGIFNNQLSSWRQSFRRLSNDKFKKNPNDELAIPLYQEINPILNKMQDNLTSVFKLLLLYEEKNTHPIIKSLNTILYKENFHARLDRCIRTFLYEKQLNGAIHDNKNNPAAFNFFRNGDLIITQYKEESKNLKNDVKIIYTSKVLNLKREFLQAQIPQ